MRWAQLHAVDGQRTFALVFETGDAVIAELRRFALEQACQGSHFTAIGAFAQVTLGYFDWQRKDYDRIDVTDQVEVLSLVGDVARGEAGDPALHAHVVVGRADGTAMGGHLIEAEVRPTLELILTESPHHLQRVADPETGLTLIDLDRSSDL